VEHLALNRRIKEEIVDSLPDWKERILAAVESLADTDGPHPRHDAAAS
jgi:hypothetical protein